MALRIFKKDESASSVVVSGLVCLELIDLQASSLY